MGLLREHKLTDYIDRYNLKYYFETGTGKAECLEYALRYPFEEYWTVDIDEDLIIKPEILDFSWGFPAWLEFFVGFTGNSVRLP